MSTVQLKSDLKEIVGKAKGFAGKLTTANDVVSFFSSDLLPWLESLVEEFGEVDEAVADLMDGAPDTLHEDTADTFASIITTGLVLATELEKRATGEPKVLEAISKFRELCEDGSNVLGEITVPDEDEDEDQESEDDKESK
jgi:hypothetical protein